MGGKIDWEHLTIINVAYTHLHVHSTSSAKLVETVFSMGPPMPGLWGPGPFCRLKTRAWMDFQPWLEEDLATNDHPWRQTRSEV